MRKEFIVEIPASNCVEEKRFETTEEMESYAYNYFKSTQKILTVFEVIGKRKYIGYFLIPFVVKNKYSETPDKDRIKLIPSTDLTERMMAHYFYPCCNKVFLKEMEIHIIPCEYDRAGFQVTKNTEIFKSLADDVKQELVNV